MSWYNPTDWGDWGDVKNFGAGAISGAGTGFMVGGPWGAVIGAGAGGIANTATGGSLMGTGGSSSSGGGSGGSTLPQYGYATDKLKQLGDMAANRQAPTTQAAQLNPSQMAQSRAGLMGTAQQLGAIASGKTAGAGEMAVNRQLGQALAQQASLARSARGANAALAYHNAARNSADMGLQGAGAAAQAQTSDQQGALGQMAGIYNSAYGQDASVAGQNAQLSQQAALANQSAQLQQQQQNDAMQIQSLGQMLGWDQATINAKIQQQLADQQKPNMLGGMLSGLGQIGLSKMFNSGSGGGSSGGFNGGGDGLMPLNY